MPATYRSSSTAVGNTVNSYSCNKPSGTIAGDVLLAHQKGSASLAAMTVPVGGATWLPLASVTGGSVYGKVWWKVAGSSEPTSYTFTQGASSYGGVVIVAIQDAAATAPIFASTATGTGANIDTPSITPAGADDLDIRFLGYQISV